MKQNKEIAYKMDEATNRPSYAAIDLGSNNCRMLMAYPEKSETGHNMIVTEGYSRPIRLGETIKETKRLSPAAMGRARDVLQVCSRKIKDEGITRIAGIATEACRYSENAAGFIKLVNELYDLPIRIISAEEEAKLAWVGCAPLIHPQAKQVVLFDIGGASTQIIYAELENGKLITQNWLSVPMGVVTLHDKIGSGPFHKTDYFKILNDIKTPFEEFIGQYPIIDIEHAQILGTSGTVTTLSAAISGLNVYRRELVDGTTLSFDETHALMLKLAQLDVDQRINDAFISSDRSDLITVGCLILSAIWDCWPLPELTVADRGLREGLLINMMREDGYKIGD